MVPAVRINCVVAQLRLPMLGGCRWILPPTLAFAVFLLTASATAPAWTADAPSAESEIWFSRTPLHIRILLSQESDLALRVTPRQYAPAEIVEGEHRYPNVQLRLKGSSGSFQSLDAKPGFTLHFRHLSHSNRFHGFKKIHLNNSAEDPSFACEALGAWFFHKAGIPVPLLGVATVELNGRPLGCYIVKEGFEDEFLQRCFPAPFGELYDNDAGPDIDSPMDRDAGDNPDSARKLQDLARAVHILDYQKRWQQMSSVLDIQRFLTFMAAEVLLGHRDGYCLARNNYRIYCPPDAPGCVFLPGGMDQILGNPGATLHPHMVGLAAAAIMATPRGQAEYDSRVRSLFQDAFHPEWMLAVVDESSRMVRPVLSRSELQAFVPAIESLKRNIHARHAFIRESLRKLPPPRFPDGADEMIITSWRPVDAPPNGSMRLSTNPSPPTLMILANELCDASWRASIVLDPGTYRFQGRYRAENAKPLPFGRRHGAHIRIGGFKIPPDAPLRTTNGWCHLAVDFTVTEPARRIEFICEFRASQGTTWFDLNSLRVKRLAPVASASGISQKPLNTP